MINSLSKSNLEIGYQTKSSSKWAPIRLNASMVLTALIHLFLMTYRFNLILQIGFSKATSNHRCSKSWLADGLFLKQNNRSNLRLFLSKSVDILSMARDKSVHIHSWDVEIKWELFSIVITQTNLVTCNETRFA